MYQKRMTTLKGPCFYCLHWAKRKGKNVKRFFFLLLWVCLSDCVLRRRGTFEKQVHMRGRSNIYIRNPPPPHLKKNGEKKRSKMASYCTVIDFGCTCQDGRKGEEWNVCWALGTSRRSAALWVPMSDELENEMIEKWRWVSPAAVSWYSTTARVTGCFSTSLENTSPCCRIFATVSPKPQVSSYLSRECRS